MTNNEIKALVLSEQKRMRGDITKIIFTRHKTGYCVAIYSDMALDHNGVEMSGGRIGKDTEWALITTVMIHRIMSKDKVLSRLRSDARLYNS